MLLSNTLTPNFSSSNSGTVGPRPLIYNHEPSHMPERQISKGVLLWILLCGSNRESHMSSSSKNPCTVCSHRVKVRDHWTKLHLKNCPIMTFLTIYVRTCMSQRKRAEVEGAILPRLLATDIVENIQNQITRKKSELGCGRKVL